TQYSPLPCHLSARKAGGRGKKRAARRTPMSVETPLVAPSVSAHTPWRSSDRRPRLWPAVAALAVYWAATLVVGQMEKPYFVGFLFGLAAPTLLALFFLGWWWFSRRIRLADRVFGFLVVLAGGLLA